MNRRLSVFLLTVVAMMLAVSIVCQAQSQALLTRHAREAVLNGEAQWVGHLPATQSMRLVLVLPHRHQAELDNFLQELYDPHSASYRKFLTVEEFTARFGPSQADYDSVIGFAKANGFRVVGTSRNRMNLDVTGSVASIERAFHLRMGVYQHPTENRTFFAPDREPMADLAVQLWHITGLDNYSTPRPALVRRDASDPAVRSGATTGSGPSDSFLGSDMRAAYYGKTALTGSGQSLGLFEFLGTDLTDLTTYYTNVGQTNNVPITLQSVDTQSTSCIFADLCDDTEQTLDMTQALGMAPGMSSLVMYIGTGGLAGQTIDDSGIFNAMATASPLNAQLSCSWQWKPSDPTTDDPYFEEFAAQGQNLFIDTGDDGTWSSSDFYWPSDSVYLTAVGGTDLETTGAGGAWASETGWVDSGGGIGPDDFPIPSWQVTAAAGCAKCSQTYRNGPDVAANADFSFYVCADQEACSANLYGGTSFATPMWAGYLALANEQYLSNGASTTLGFINPALYAIGLSSNYDADFHDCRTGGNTDGCTVGYDLSTGWGSPNGAGLINALALTPISEKLTISPASLAFGKTVTVETTSKAKTLTIKNAGSKKKGLAVIIESESASPPVFRVTSGCEQTLDPGKSCKVSVTFTPPDTLLQTAKLLITDNVTGSPQRVPLSGTGKAAKK
ncbi:protease pro-enzyme activation domain-containing protein [Candidatus Binatus sp.]|uniref:protease pro-enzyme activation domain-containing protein n=1 Tax=Candidatus Binatus sp. TaxID=2811406 RepID=UPI003D12D45D